MKTSVVLIISVLLFIGINSAFAAQDESPLYSNKDLEKYKSGPDSGMQVGRPAGSQEGIKKEKVPASSSRKNQHDGEYWCKKATPLRKKIEKAAQDVSEQEKRLGIGPGQSDGPVVITGRNRAQAQSLEKKKRILKERQADLAELEAEAHKKDVPPGWLRCQFE